MVVERVEEFLMQNLADAGHRVAVEADGGEAFDGVVVGFGIAVAAGDDLDAPDFERCALGAGRRMCSSRRSPPRAVASR